MTVTISGNSCGVERSPNQEKLAELVGLLHEVFDKIRPEDVDVISKQVGVIFGPENPHGQRAAWNLVKEIVDHYRGPQPRAEEIAKPQRDSKTDKWRAHISNAVYQIRNQSGMTQDALAIKTGIPQSHISRIESGEVSPTFKTVAKIAAALGVEHSKLDPSV